MTDSTTKRYLLTEEVAQIFRVSPETVRCWKFIGKIKGIKIGRRALYTEAECDRLAREAEAAASR